MSVEEEAFFKAHPAAFEVGTIVNDQVQKEDKKEQVPGTGSAKKSVLSGLNLAWRFSAGKSRQNHK